MTQTPNYKLTQWAKTDRIRMEDFNGDNSKIDAALKAHDTAIAAKAAQSALSAETSARKSNVTVNMVGTFKTGETYNMTIEQLVPGTGAWMTVSNILGVGIRSDCTTYAATLASGTLASGWTCRVAYGNNVYAYFSV